jgi:poly(beta-D-mannuronate) lyase
VDIPGVAYYTDARHSVRDQTLFQLNREALRPLDRYLSRITRMSDAFVQGDEEAGRCTLAWLTTWAKEGALLGEPTAGAQARSQRRWSGAGMTLSALMVLDAASEEDRAVLRPYVSRLAQAVQRDATLDKLRNNLLYWAGLVYMASSSLTGDAQLRDQAVAICRDAIASFTPAGSLPLEDLRGDRAIDYNGFALFPLSVTATLNGPHGKGCSLAELRPLAAYVLAHRDGTSDPFLRWAPFMGMDVALRPEALFYSYGGGSLNLVAEKLAALARARSP